MKESIEKLESFKALVNMNFTKINFERGLGIIEPKFIISFGNETLNLEIETNFRIRNSEEILLSFNDLYIDSKRKEMSIKKFRSQTTIEKSYLFQRINYINKILKNSKIYKIIVKEYGDIYLYFKNNIVMEILNDTHLEGAILFRLIHYICEKPIVYKCLIQNNNLLLLEDA